MAALNQEDLIKYVTSGERVPAEGTVLLNIKHNLLSRHFAEIQFHLESDIEDVRDRIYLITGSRPEFVELRYLGIVLEDGKTLGSYYPAQYGTLEVIDHDPDSLAKDGGLDDTSKIERYVMSDEEYNKRPNTYRAWKKKMIEENPKWVAPWIIKQRDERMKQLEKYGPILPIEEVQEKYPLESRVECSPGARRGTIKYVGYLGSGPFTYADGVTEPATVWIGVVLDNPEGKNDGTFNGKRYFEASPGFGGFFRPQNVVVGDFEVDDPFASSDDDLDEEL